MGLHPNLHLNLYLCICVLVVIVSQCLDLISYEKYPIITKKKIWSNAISSLSHIEDVKVKIRFVDVTTFCLHSNADGTPNTVGPIHLVPLTCGANLFSI